MKQFMEEWVKEYFATERALTDKELLAKAAKIIQTTLSERKGE